MPGDKASSRDSAVIDDDLVEALGFEPLSTTRADKEDSSTSDDVVVDDASDSDLDEDGQDASARQGVVILGDVIPVEAGDPVASDIAAAILGDSSDDDADDDSIDLDASDESIEVDEDKSQDVDELTDDSDEGDEKVLDLAGLDDDELADGDGFGVFEAEKADGSEETAGFFDHREDAESDAETVDDLVDGDEKIDLGSVDADGFGPGILAKGFDPEETASAFPDVPDLSGSERLPAKLDNRDLHTRPVELDQDDLESLDVGVFSVDGGEDSSESLLDTELAPVAVGVPPTKTGYRPKRIRAKKTRRVIRHIDPWSVLTFSVLFHLALYAAFLLASVLVWKTLEASGMVENIEDFIIALGDYETYQINADVLFRAGVIIAGILTVASTILSVLLSVVFNLISDLVGGIRVTVLEEETVRLPSKRSAAKSR